MENIRNQSSQHWYERLQRIFSEQVGSLTSFFSDWRSPGVGYLVSLLFTGAALGVGVVETQLLSPFSFPGLPLLLAAVLVAFFWGTGPAILSILLSVVVLDFFYVPPAGTFNGYAWTGLLQLFTFIVIGVALSLFIRHCEITRQRALVAEQAAIQRVQQLEETLEALNKKAVIDNQQDQIRQASTTAYSNSPDFDKRLEAQQSVLEEELVDTICDRLKQPLVVMRGSLLLAEHKVQDLLTTEIPSSIDMRRFSSIRALFERMKQTITVQHRIVNDLIDINHIQAGRLELWQMPCNLTQVIKKVVQEVRESAPVHTIQLTLSSKEAIMVHGDVDRLEQVTRYLLSNALQHSAADRAIEVRLHVELHRVTVLVEDEGQGIAEDEREQIWDCFYRGASATGESGLGTGLYISRAIIELHGGSMGFQSTLEQGSTFWFTLPRARFYTQR